MCQAATIIFSFHIQGFIQVKHQLTEADSFSQLYKSDARHENASALDIKFHKKIRVISAKIKRPSTSTLPQSESIY